MQDTQQKDEYKIARYREDLEFEFVQKKRLTEQSYQYRNTPMYDTYLKEAAELCDKLDVMPSQLVKILYERMPHDKKEFFSPKHLRGDAAEQSVKKHMEDHREVTLWSLPLQKRYDYERSLLAAQIELRRKAVGNPKLTTDDDVVQTITEVLMDSSMKFSAWFRILGTKFRIPVVIDKYKEIARIELTGELMSFIRDKQLDIGRILD